MNHDHRLGAASLLIWALLAGFVGPPMGKTELFENTGFEDKLTGWRALDMSKTCEFEIDKKVKKSGKASVRVELIDNFVRPSGKPSVVIELIGSYSSTHGSPNGDEWKFQLSEPGTYRALAMAGERVICTGTEFEVQGGEDLELQAMVVEEGATLVLQLEPEEGHVPAGIRAYLRRGASQRAESFTFAGGNDLRIENLEPGAGRISFLGKNIQQTELEFELAPGKDTQLVVAVGTPAAQTLRDAAEGKSGVEYLCAPESAQHLAGLLDGWTQERALLFQLQDPDRLAPETPTVRALQPEDPLDHLSSDLREELLGVGSSSAVWCALEGSLPASFAYAYWRTEGQFDLSIDTAPEFRRKGLARQAISECIRQESASGRVPVWGAMESNTGSRRLAESLGFVEHDHVMLFTRA